MPQKHIQYLFAILHELDFEHFLAKERPGQKVGPDNFNKNAHAFRQVYYFLFKKLLGSEKTKANFRSVYPARDKKQEADFKKLVIQLLEDYHQKNPGALIKVPAIAFERLYGQQYDELSLRFAKFVFEQVMKRYEDKFALTCPFGPDVTGKEAQETVSKFEQEVQTFAQQLNSYEARVDEKIKQLTLDDTKIDEELAKLENYRSAEFLIKVNQELEKRLKSVVDYLKDILHGIEAKSSSNTMNNSGQNEADVGKQLMQQLNQFNMMLNLFKNNHNELISALKNSKHAKKCLDDAREKLKRASKDIAKLEEALARVKGEVYATPRAQEMRKAMLDYLKPVMDVSLNFSDYGLHESFSK